MKSLIVAVRDQKSVTFTQPVTVPTKGMALRSWGDQLSDPANANQEQAKHPEDFSLWIIGEFDDNTGEITPQKPEQLAVASDLKR
nr:MAG: nonstructural protein [Microvirus sp.]